MKSRAEYSITNRIYWNEVASVHQDNYVNELLQRISDPDFTTFDPIEQKLFKKISLSGKAVAQICCNNARELISVKKAGAGRCVGFDISDDATIQLENGKRIKIRDLKHANMISNGGKDITYEYLDNRTKKKHSKTNSFETKLSSIGKIFGK